MNRESPDVIEKRFAHLTNSIVTVWHEEGKDGRWAVYDGDVKIREADKRQDWAVRAMEYSWGFIVAKNTHKEA
jgi:hypothetical protein